MAVFQSRKKDIVVRKTAGIEIFTDDKVYLDAISGIFNMPYGYACQPIINEIKDAYDTYPFHPKEHFYTKDYLAVADCLLDAADSAQGGILFLNSGSEGVEAAISMALQYHRLGRNGTKEKIIARNCSYHGATLGARSVTGRNNFGDLVAEGFRTVRIPPPFKHGAECTDRDFGLDDLERRILAEDPSTIAAFIFEPVNHLKGMYPASLEYLQGVRKLCTEYDIIMIADEVITGMYRTRKFLYTQHAALLPDIVVLGKGISSGYTPVSVVIAQPHISTTFNGDQCWRYFPYSHTYAGNPVGLRAVKATFDHFHKEEQKTHFEQLTNLFESRVDQLKAEKGVRRAESVGLLAGISFDRHLGPDCGHRLEELCFKRGLIIRGEEDWITLAPCYNTGFDQLSIIFAILSEAIAQLSLKNPEV